MSDLYDNTYELLIHDSAMFDNALVYQAEEERYLLKLCVCIFLYAPVHQKLRNFEGIGFFFLRDVIHFIQIFQLKFSVRWLILYKQILFLPFF